MRPTFLAALIAICCFCAQVKAQGPSISGRVLDPDGLSLPGVTVTLRPAGGEPLVTATGENGEFAIDGLRPGLYDLEASLDSFATATRHGIDLSQGHVTLNLQLAVATVREDVTISAPAPSDVLGSAHPNAPVTATRQVIDIAMLPNSQFDDVLPLMPNVVRGPDGLISVGGARASSGGLFVNTMNAADPIMGGAGMMLPLEAVDTMQVYAGGAPAEFGGATGGLTSVQTRAGTDHFHMELNSFFPRLLYTNDGVSGVEYWDPNLGFSGPAITHRVTYQQALSYRYDHNSYTTLTGPDHNIFTALLSWTQVDARLSDTERVRVSVNADPRDTDRANITAFTTGDAAPGLKQGGWATSVSHTQTARNVLIELRGSYLQTSAAVTPDRDDPYVIAHQLTTGSYFDRQDRSARRIEGGTRVTWPIGAHQTVTTGVTVTRTVADQFVQGAAITMLHSDGAAARAITFTPAPSAPDTSTMVVGGFGQDAWAVSPWLTFDAGVRYDATTGAANAPVSPRAGWTLARSGGRTTFSGSAGLFADTLPLAALGFSALPSRQVVTFDADGHASTSTVTNIVDPTLQVAQALRWDLELDQRFGAWLVRARYAERHGTHELVVNPVSASLAPGAVTTPDMDLLSSPGTSRARSVETTAGFRSTDGNEWFLSYVRTGTFGDQNSLSATEGLMRVAFVQPNQRGPLTSDVPHRILAWGVFHLPGQVTVAPFLDTHSGFPFTAIDDGWLTVGMANAYRLPWTAALDLSATWIVGLPRHLPQARVGIKLYNLISTHTERDVQRNIDRPDFGTRYNPVPRDFSFVFEFLWGRRHQA